MVNSRIIALDPGGTTGWGTYSFNSVPVPNDIGYEVYDETFACGQLGPREHYDELYALLELMHVQDTLVVCEAFQQYRDRNNVDLISVEYIGVVKLFCQQRGIPIYFQASSEGKIGKSSFVRPENLKLLHLWSGGQRHAMDAYGHLLCYLLNHKGAHPDVRLRLLTQGWK